MDLYDDNQVSSHDNDEKEYYFDFIQSYEDSGFSKREILEQLCDELDLSRAKATRVLKQYLAEKDDYDYSEEADDIVEDDDYSDGNTEE